MEQQFVGRLWQDFRQYCNQMGRKYGVPGNGANDALDAFRHAFASAWVVVLGGRGLSWLLGEIVEITNPSNEPKQAAMDRYNNAVGRRIGYNSPEVKFRPYEQWGDLLAQKIALAYFNGELKILEKNNSINLFSFNSFRNF